ncbi:MAG: aminoglycoside phosphotransferase family protein [Thermomicrobiales bacterium]
MTPQGIEIPEYFKTFIESYFGEAGTSWLAEIPRIVSRYADLWALEIEGPFDGLTYNYVTGVKLVDGSQAVLKVGVPEKEQRAEIFALRAFEGRGIVRLFASSVDDHVALIERLSPGTMLSTYFPDRDGEATAIAAGIMNDLAIPAPPDREQYSTVEGWFVSGMQHLREAFDGGTGPFPEPLVDRAESLSVDLLASTGDRWLIHGDLHHMNILSTDNGRGWLAIDPKGVIGDRAYEAAPFLLNPNTMIHGATDLDAILARRIDILSEMLDIDRRRIHGWALAFSVLSSWWSYSGTGEWRRTLALGERLASM